MVIAHVLEELNAPGRMTNARWSLAAGSPLWIGTEGTPMKIPRKFRSHLPQPSEPIGSKPNPSLRVGALAIWGCLFCVWLWSSRPAGARSLDLTPVLSGLDDVSAIAHAGDDRLFLVSKEGRVWILRNGALQPEPYLDIRDRVLFTGEPESEQGLLTLAFHPDYSVNGYLFVGYTGRNGDGVVSRFSVTGPNPDRASSGSERSLLVVPQPGPNHNLNHMAFGPDGMLYVSSGDGGYQPEPRCTPQEGQNLLGKLLRLDVTSSAETAPYFSVPSDNPFVGQGSIRNEIWALGLRNPWRFSFDAQGGDLWLADVGHRLREEINVVSSGSPGGQNFGFKMMEGLLCRGSSTNCGSPIPSCFDPAYTDPVLDYGHDGRHCAIIGGQVYRGSRIPQLRGLYVAGDFCGATFLVDPSGGSYTREPLGLDLPSLVTWGEDADGELFALAKGVLYRVDGLLEDVTVAFERAEYRVREDAGTAQLLVRRAGDTVSTVSASYRLRPISAGVGDYVASEGRLVWLEGEDLAALSIEIVDDNEFEGNERFQVELFDPVGAELGATSTAEVIVEDNEAPGVCMASDTVLCLTDDRFRVSVTWTDFGGEPGVGHAVPLSGVLPDGGLGASGLMWFFRADNAELLIKVLSACGVNGHHWVFMAAATDVQYSVEVIDTETGAIKVYTNSLGQASPATTDIEAFSCS